MIGRGITIAVMIGALGSPAVAQPVPPPKTDGAAAAEVPQRTEEDRIARLIKTAEREGFEHHELERALAIFAPEASVVIGRRAEPDEHDVKMDLGGLRGTLIRRHRLSPSKQQQLFFRDVEVQITGEAATMIAVVTREHHTGREELKLRYRLARRDGRWQVVERRSWPLMRSYGGLPTVYSDEVWTEAEKNAEKILADEYASQQSRLSALTQAGFLARAHAETVAWTRRAPDDHEAWRARLRFAVELGRVADMELSEKTLAALEAAGGAKKKKK